MIAKNYFTHAKIKPFVRAGFFTRNGGVSKKENNSLNCSLNSKDTKVNVNKNSNLKKNLINDEVDRLINSDRMGKLFKCLVVSNL